MPGVDGTEIRWRPLSEPTGLRVFLATVSFGFLWQLVEKEIDGFGEGRSHEPTIGPEISASEGSTEGNPASMSPGKS
jgi:hypothetical protein